MQFPVHPQWYEVIADQLQLRDAILDYWLHHDLFTGQWWFVVIVLVGVWVMWARLVRRHHLLMTVLYGTMIALIATYLDAVGASLVLWEYPHMEAPLMAPAFWADLGAFPVLYMLLYQRFPQWPKFLLAAAVGSAAIAFVVEPLLMWLGIYELYNWSLWCSLIAYFIMAVGCRGLMELVHAATEA